MLWIKNGRLGGLSHFHPHGWIISAGDIQKDCEVYLPNLIERHLHQPMMTSPYLCSSNFVNVLSSYLVCMMRKYFSSMIIPLHTVPCSLEGAGLHGQTQLRTKSAQKLVDLRDQQVPKLYRGQRSERVPGVLSDKSGFLPQRKKKRKEGEEDVRWRATFSVRL